MEDGKKGDSQRLWGFESSDCPDNKTTLDKVLDDIPVGWFHYRSGHNSFFLLDKTPSFRLLIICGLAFMADAMEVSLLAFISTCADQDWNLTDSQVASITSVVFAGQLIGSIFWGPLADYYGRKIVFISGRIRSPMPC
jgi:hypothetical protein